MNPSVALPATPAPPALNADQQQAATALLEFLFNDEREFLLNGPGGTGKTHLIGHLIREIYPQYVRTCALLGDRRALVGVALTATTNKAAEQLARATDCETSTIHSLLGLTIRQNFRTGQEELTRSNSWSIKQDLVIVIDEASMINRQLLGIIRESVLNCKLIFVSDHCQLGPVGELRSPIFVQRLPMQELTIPERNAGQPALVQLCEQMRTMVLTGAIRPITPVPGVVDVLDASQMEQELAQHFQPGDYSARILAFTNNRVKDYNQYVRQLRQQHPQLYAPGELLINNERVMSNNGHLSANALVRVHQRSQQNQQQTLDPADRHGTPLEWISHTYHVVTLSGSYHTIQVPEDPEHFQQILKYLAKHKAWTQYFGLKNRYADLRDYSASTVHKAQGSTFTTVFIDLLDFQRCRNRTTLLQLLYTAFTRPSTRMFLYGDLTDKQGLLLPP